ncbi:unnamed protein product [Rhizoctonia solani]|uniref:Protein kinase domain-containing protein n=1 Tax=Rhizoctonia solani TaxID=456999 RepID=A0A8H3DM27_9AGAM|nr:unnamed protein product [Rhizoctonia solani]
MMESESEQIFDIFQSHGVPNLTPDIDFSTVGKHAVAAGGLSDVYHARLLDGSVVAVKSLRISFCDSEDLQTLKHIAHELYIWSRCKHRNILELNGTAHVRGRIALISPWMENGSVPDFVLNHPGAPRYDMCAQLVAAVSYLHDVGVVHGNIRGANVLVTADLTIKLGSLGGVANSGGLIDLPCPADSEFLSIRWAAPEFMTGVAGRPTFYTDVYALGMTILEIFSGSIPYRDVHLSFALLNRIMNGTPPNRPEELAKDDTRADVLWPLLLKCWSYDPSKRPAASDVLEVMNVLLATG